MVNTFQEAIHLTVRFAKHILPAASSPTHPMMLTHYHHLMETTAPPTKPLPIKPNHTTSSTSHHSPPSHSSSVCPASSRNNLPSTNKNTRNTPARPAPRRRRSHTPPRERCTGAAAHSEALSCAMPRGCRFRRRRCRCVARRRWRRNSLLKAVRRWWCRFGIALGARFRCRPFLRRRG